MNQHVVIFSGVVRRDWQIGTKVLVTVCSSGRWSHPNVNLN